MNRISPLTPAPDIARDGVTAAARRGGAASPPSFLAQLRKAVDSAGRPEPAMQADGAPGVGTAEASGPEAPKPERSPGSPFSATGGGQSSSPTAAPTRASGRGDAPAPVGDVSEPDDEPTAVAEPAAADPSTEVKGAADPAPTGASVASLPPDPAGHGEAAPASDDAAATVSKPPEAVAQGRPRLPHTARRQAADLVRSDAVAPNGPQVDPSATAAPAHPLIPDHPATAPDTGQISDGKDGGDRIPAPATDGASWQAAAVEDVVDDGSSAPAHGHEHDDGDVALAPLAEPAPGDPDPSALLPAAGAASPPPANALHAPARSPERASAPITARPAEQLAAPLLQFAAKPDGAQSLTIKLDPVELGELRIRIERGGDGPVQVTVEATRPETLRLLHQDEPALHRALDQAGLPAEGRVVLLQQAPSDGGARQNATYAGDAGGGGDRQAQRGGHDWEVAEAGDVDQRSGASEIPRWTRAGINITA